MLIGHSIAGEELSSVATRRPERIAGLIYLDAAYAYAYYDRLRGDLDIDTIYFERELGELQARLPGSSRQVADLQKKLAELEDFGSRPGPKWAPFVHGLLQADLPAFAAALRTLKVPRDEQIVDELLQTDIPGLETDLKEAQGDVRNTRPQPKPQSPAGADAKAFAAFHSWEMRVRGFATPEEELRQQYGSRPNGEIGKPHAYMNSDRVFRAITAGVQKYTDIHVPVLAVYAPKTDPSQLAQQKAFAAGVSGSRVVLLPNASHHVFLSNEADVLREIRSFLDALK